MNSEHLRRRGIAVSQNGREGIMDDRTQGLPTQMLSGAGDRGNTLGAGGDSGE